MFRSSLMALIVWMMATVPFVVAQDVDMSSALTLDVQVDPYALQLEQLNWSPYPYSFTQSTPSMRNVNRYSQKLQSKWADVLEAIGQNDLRRVNLLITDLNKLKVEHGLEALEEYSLVLIDEAKKRLADKSGDRERNDTHIEEAGFLARKASLLSPDSPVILVQSIPLLPHSGEGGMLSNISRAIKQSFNHPMLILSIVNRMIYPMLWALTLSLYLVLVFYLSYRLKDLLVEAATNLPSGYRGYLAPAVCFAALIFPMMAGPLWCLGLWGALVLVAVPDKKWVAFCAGCVLMLWGAMIPIRETLTVWLADRSVQTMLNVSAGYYSSSDKAELESLLIQNPEDGVVVYSYGQLLRRLGELEMARQMVLRAEMLLGLQPWTKAQQGMISYLQGDPETADVLFNEARELGLDSPELKFNYSKVKFDLLDTIASQELYSEANREDPHLARTLREREDLLGIKSYKGLAEIRLPLSNILGSALRPIAGAVEHQDKVASMMMPGLSPVTIMFAGLGLVFWFIFVAKGPPRRNYLKAYVDSHPPQFLVMLLRCVPGGPWIISGKLRIAFLILSALILACMPLIAWPAKFFILEPSHTYFMLYVMLLGITVTAVMVLGLWMEES